MRVLLHLCYKMVQSIFLFFRKFTMAADKQTSVQDVFLNHVRKHKNPVTIFLVNGVKLQGCVTWFDNFCILLRRDNHSQLVYKHSVSTIMPQGPIQLFEASEDNSQNENTVNL